MDTFKLRTDKAVLKPLGDQQAGSGAQEPNKQNDLLVARPEKRHDS